MMDRRAVLIGFGACAISAVPLDAHAQSSKRRTSAVVTRQALNAINHYRKSNGKDPVVIDPRAEKAALTHSKEMALLGRLSHDKFKQRLLDAEIVSPSAENIATGQQSIKGVLSAWKKSPDHRKNLLGPYNRIGLAMARNANSGNVPYWTLILSV